MAVSTILLGISLLRLPTPRSSNRITGDRPPIEANEGSTLHDLNRDGERGKREGRVLDGTEDFFR